MSKPEHSNKDIISFIQFKQLNDNAQMPYKAHLTDAGFDLFSSETIEIGPRTNGLIHLGIAMAIPVGYCAVIKDRSGLAVKNRIYTRAGVIDSDYRGEVCAVIENGSDTTFAVTIGMKIAQMLILPVPIFEMKQVETLDETVRGKGGFGSTGK